MLMFNNNKIFQTLILAMVFILNLCCQDGKKNTAEKPKNLVSTKQMELILGELHMVDALVNQRGLAADSAKKMSTDFYDFIYRKYGVEKNDFNNSYQYYLNNPIEMDSIYVNVLENLNIENLKLNKAVVDSLQKPAMISVDSNVSKGSKLNMVK